MAEQAPSSEENRDHVTGASYDETPYESYAYPFTHPEKTGAVAHILGFNHTPLEKARVLELGCAGGGNILPLAARYPDAEFFGIDLSPAQIDEANAHKEALGYKNISFEALDIMDFNTEKGSFDYIMCHGVFSWVPDFVREKILTICQEQLSENGIASISFNVLPGWAPLRSIREMMILHTEKFEDPAKKIEQAKVLLKYLYDYMPQDSSLRKAVENVYNKFLETKNDSYILHEYLEANNQPYYFSQFAEMLDAHALNYIGDSDITMMQAKNINPALGETLDKIPELTTREQYMDFITNRQFRYAIVTPKGNASSNVSLDALEDLHYACNLVSEQQEFSEENPMRFVRADKSNFEVTANDPAGKALFWGLTQERNYFHSFEQVFDIVNTATGSGDDPEALRKTVKATLLNLILRGALQFSLTPSSHPLDLSNKPKAFSLARYQAGLPNCAQVTNVHSTQIGMNAIDAHVLRYLDGTRNTNQIVNIVADHLKNGDVTLRRGGIPIADTAQQKKEFKTVLPQLLDNYRKKHLLVE